MLYGNSISTVIAVEAEKNAKLCLSNTDIIHVAIVTITSMLGNAISLYTVLSLKFRIDQGQ